MLSLGERLCRSRHESPSTAFTTVRVEDPPSWKTHQHAADAVRRRFGLARNPSRTSQVRREMSMSSRSLPAVVSSATVCACRSSPRCNSSARSRGTCRSESSSAATALTMAGGQSKPYCCRWRNRGLPAPGCGFPPVRIGKGPHPDPWPTMCAENCSRDRTIAASGRSLLLNPLHQIGVDEAV